MAKKPIDGQLDAHTPPAASADAAAQVLPGADPLDLLAGSPDLGALDVLAKAAEIVAAPRRARGRPAGAANRKNGDMIRYLEALGHRDPWVTLSLIQSADFGALCKVVGATSTKHKLAVLGIQRGAASDLMNYHHSKKPQQLDLPVGDKRPLMIVGDGNNVAVFAGGGYASDEFLAPEQTQGNQGVIDGESVRDDAEPSHD